MNIENVKFELMSKLKSGVEAVENLICAILDICPYEELENKSGIYNFGIIAVYHEELKKTLIEELKNV